MGEVYLAQDTTLDRKIALKVLPAELAADPDRLARFKREAKTLAALDHPNIVTIHSVESAILEEPSSKTQTSGPKPQAPSPPVRFLTMQFVEGEPLSRLIPKRGMPLKRIFEIAIPSSIGCATA